MKRFVLFLLVVALGYSQEFEWTQFDPIISETGTAPKIGVDADGNAHAIWIDGMMVMASFWDGSSWSTPEAISGGGSTIVSCDLGVDSDGNAIAVWSDSEPTVYANVYTPGIGWATEEDITNTADDTSFPTVSVNNQGGATVVWRRLFFGSYQVPNARLYSFGAVDPWNPPLDEDPFFPGNTPEQANFIQTASAYGTEELDPTFTLNGLQGIITYVNEADMVSGAIRVGGVLSYDEDGSPVVTTSALFEISPTISNPRPAIAVNPADGQARAIAIWNSDDMSTNDIQYSLMSIVALPFIGPVVIWSAAAPISGSTAPTSTSSPAIAQDSNSNALAVWISYDGADGTIYASFYNRTMDSWSTPEAISSASSDVATPRVAFRLDGTAVVLWEQGGAIQARSRDTSGNWFPDLAESPTEISNAGASVEQLAIQGTADGTPFAIWEGSVEGAMGAESSVESPTVLQAFQELHRFPAQGDLINVLVYTAPDLSAVASFRIYRDSLSTKIGDTSQTRFEDHQRVPGQTVTYYITAVNSEGDESDPTAVTVPPL